MIRSEAKRKVQSLVDKIQKEHGVDIWLSVISDKGKVDFVAVNTIKGDNQTATKKAIRRWAKKNKVKLKWLPRRNNPTRPSKTKRRRKNQPQIPPPFKKLTKKKINKLKGLFRVHDDVVMNPEPSDCPNCDMPYKDLKTGLDFQAVKDMLWIQDPDSEFWRHKRRGSVLGLWFEIKRGMWADHLEMCGGKPLSEAEYLDHLEQVEGY
jgi:hypothetical protein